MEKKKTQRRLPKHNSRRIEGHQNYDEALTYSSENIGNQSNSIKSIIIMPDAIHRKQLKKVRD
jgi:hypothetical protein